MMKLSPRLKKIAEQINAGETMADIGTDHGFLPIYLWENKICPKVIMADISSGSLLKARENCEMYDPDASFDLRLGSGIEVLKEAEVDAVVMAGMGGILMTEILEKDIKKSLSFRKLILQPRKDVGKLRYWLFNNGFSITNEALVREGKYICEIITAVPKEVAITRQMNGDDIEYEFPHSLIDYNDELLEEYLNTKRKLEASHLAMNSINDRTCCIKNFKVFSLSFSFDFDGNAVSGKNQNTSIWNFIDIFHKNHPFLGQILDYMAIVNYLVKDINRFRTKLF